MWQVENQTPFAVERGSVRDRSGAEVWLVACHHRVQDLERTIVSRKTEVAGRPLALQLA